MLITKITTTILRLLRKGGKRKREKRRESQGESLRRKNSPLFLVANYGATLPLRLM